MSLAPAPLRLVRALDLAAASGLVRLGGRSFVVGDDDLDLHVYPDDGGPPLRLPLRPGTLPADPKARKRSKPDFEALCRWPGGLLVLGSGSTLARQTGAFVQLSPDMSPETAREFSLAPLYAGLAGRLPGLNVEGAAALGDDLALVQRGNGAGNRSGLILLDRAAAEAAVDAGAAWTPALVRDVRLLEFGTIGGVAYTPTDAAPLPGGGLLLSLAAEDSPDTYADGACLGSALACLGPDLAVRWLAPLPGDAKIEGVAVEPEGARLRVHLVADPDDPNARSPLFTLALDPRTGALDP